MSFLVFLKKRIKKYALFLPTVSLSLGIILGVVEEGNLKLLAPIVVLLIVSVMGVTVALRSRFFMVMTLLGGGFVIGNLRFRAVEITPDNRIDQIADGAVHTLSGTVSNVEASNGRTFITIDELTRQDGVSFTGKVRLSLDHVEMFVRDQVLSFETRLELPENWDQQFDYVKYLNRKNIYAIGKIHRYEIVGSKKGLIHSVDQIRHRSIKLVRSNLNEPEASLLLGLTIGYRASFDENFEEQLSQTGTTHIVAASGYNVALVVGAMLSIQAILGRRIGGFLAALACLLFCFLTGGNLPVVRASLMVLIVMFIRELGREIDMFTILTFAFASILLLEPMSLWDLGFQLSFASTAGIVFFSSMFKDQLINVPQILRESFFSTLGAFVATLPIIVGNFQQFSLLLFLSNLLVLPAVTLATILGFITILINFVSESLGLLMSIVVYVPLKYIIIVIERLSEISYGIIRIGGNAEVYHAIVFYLILVAVVVLYQYKSSLQVIYDEPLG